MKSVCASAHSVHSFSFTPEETSADLLRAIISDPSAYMNRLIGFFDGRTCQLETVTQFVQNGCCVVCVFLLFFLLLLFLLFCVFFSVLPERVFAVINDVS